jgi:hypothetical protein
MSSNQAEVEIRTVLNILQGAGEDIERMEAYWPASRRGSNAQKMLDSLKNRLDAANLCANDALAALSGEV